MRFYTVTYHTWLPYAGNTQNRTLRSKCYWVDAATWLRRMCNRFKLVMLSTDTDDVIRYTLDDAVVRDFLVILRIGELVYVENRM